MGPMTKLLTTHLARLAAAYAGHKNLKLSTLGIFAVNDAEFFTRAERGVLRTTGYDKALAWFEAHWPKDLAWPAGVPRASAVWAATKGRGG